MCILYHLVRRGVPRSGAAEETECKGPKARSRSGRVATGDVCAAVQKNVLAKRLAVEYMQSSSQKDFYDRSLAVERGFLLEYLVVDKDLQRKGSWGGVGAEVRVLLHRGRGAKIAQRTRFPSGPSFCHSKRPLIQVQIAGKMVNASYLVRLSKSKAEADEVAIVRGEVVEDVASLRRGITK